jgi:hypothetical protein
MLKPETLLPPLQQFETVVLKHLTQMHDDEGSHFRTAAPESLDRVHAVGSESLVQANDSRAAVLNDFVSWNSGPSVTETLNANFRFKSNAIIIGKIEAQPVYYIEGCGIYIWGEDPSSSMTLSFWATAPAYPPSW